VIPRLATIAGLQLLGCLAVGCVRAPPSTAGSSEGLASWYGGKQFAGKPTASGEPFDPRALTAAHRTLPFGSCVNVELISTGQSVDVRINDRGPYAPNRLIDLSEEAARQLGLLSEGLGRVRLRPCR
jgi:rare lipoprotein A